jgi:hypothetical protein
VNGCNTRTTKPTLLLESGQYSGPTSATLAPGASTVFKLTSNYVRTSALPGMMPARLTYITQGYSGIVYDAQNGTATSSSNLGFNFAPSGDGQIAQAAFVLSNYCSSRLSASPLVPLLMFLSQTVSRFPKSRSRGRRRHRALRVAATRGRGAPTLRPCLWVRARRPQSRAPRRRVRRPTRASRSTVRCEFLADSALQTARRSERATDDRRRKHRLGLYNCSVGFDGDE